MRQQQTGRRVIPVLKSQQKIYYNNRKQNSNQKLQSIKSIKDSYLQQSSIAQQDVIPNENKLQQKLNVNLKQNAEEKPENRDSYFDKFNEPVVNNNKKDSFFLLAESLNNKIQIVTIKEIKAYEQNAKGKYLTFRSSLNNSQLPFLQVPKTITSLKQQKHIKKSLSSSKLSRENKQGQHIKKHNIAINEIQQNIEMNRQSLDFQSVDSSHERQLRFSLQGRKRSPKIIPHSVPFSYQNVNTARNNLYLHQEKQLQLEINSSGSVRSQQFGSVKYNHHHQNEDQYNKVKQNKKTSSQILKQLNSSKFLIDVPLNLDDFRYELKIQATLQKNRGFQLYLVSPQIDQFRQVSYEDLQHFKYEIVRLPYNLIRLRVYLLIQSESENKKKNQQGPIIVGQSSSIMEGKKTWKVWKQLQVPLTYCNNEKDQENQQTIVHNNNKINITLTNINLNTVRAQINNTIDFNLTLNHPPIPVSYYCLHQDFNGVEFDNIAFSGSQSIKYQDLGQGCQGKCQLI